MPLVFSPIEPRTLFHAANRSWKTTDAGQHWAAISADLTRATWAVPPNVGKYAATDAAKPTRRGVIYALAPSPLDKDLLWAGTDDGLIHVTRDGGQNWKDITPPLLKPWAKVAGLEASHFDPWTAWAAVNTIRLDDLRPHVLRTRDGGATWEDVVNGLPVGANVNAVREDPKRPGLLYAGTERAVFVSLDSGDTWAPLRLNLPNTSVRDLLVKGGDLVLATHGRGFWILDDVTPLRQLTSATLSAPVELIAPQTALRVRFSTGSDTPLPPDEPVGQNPPDGAILDYLLREPWVLPGRYQIKLATGDGADARVVTQVLIVEMDPRVQTWIDGLRAQHALSGALVLALERSDAAMKELTKLGRVDVAGSPLEAKEARLAEANAPRTLAAMRRRLRRVLQMVEQADLAPTPALDAAGAKVLAEEAQLEASAAALRAPPASR